MPVCQFCGSYMEGYVCPRCGGQSGPAPYQGQSYPAPAYSQPGYEQPQYGQPAYGQPAYNQPAYGQPAYGTPQPGYAPYPAPIPYAPQPQGPGWQVIVGILCGIGGILLSVISCTLAGIVLGVVAIGLGQAAKKENQSGASAPIGLGVAAIVIAIIWYVALGAALIGSF